MIHLNCGARSRSESGLSWTRELRRCILTETSSLPLLSIASSPHDQRCAKRALMTGHIGSACAVLNHVCTALSVSLLNALNERFLALMAALPSSSANAPGLELTPSKIASAKAAAASAKQAADALARQAGDLARAAGANMGSMLGGAGVSEASSTRSYMKVCIALNNLEAAATYCAQMHDTLHQEVRVAGR